MKGARFIGRAVGIGRRKGGPAGIDGKRGKGGHVMPDHCACNTAVTDRARKSARVRCPPRSASPIWNGTVSVELETGRKPRVSLIARNCAAADRTTSWPGSATLWNARPAPDGRGGLPGSASQGRGCRIGIRGRKRTMTVRR